MNTRVSHHYCRHGNNKISLRQLMTIANTPDSRVNGHDIFYAHVSHHYHCHGNTVHSTLTLSQPRTYVRKPIRTYMGAYMLLFVFFI